MNLFEESKPPSRGEADLNDQEEEEMNVMEAAPLVAFAPDASVSDQQGSASPDICAGPAFQYLDEVSVITILGNGILGEMQTCC